MTKIITTILFILIFSTTAFANVGLCLEDATNAQLLKELQVRLNNPNIGSTYAVPTVTCFGANMTVLLLSSDGIENKETMSTVSSSSCDLYAQQIIDKLQNKVINNVVVASCRGSVLDRLLLKADGSISKLQALSFVNSSKCEEKATEVNSQ